MWKIRRLMCVGDDESTQIAAVYQDQIYREFHKANVPKSDGLSIDI